MRKVKKKKSVETLQSEINLEEFDFVRKLKVGEFLLYSNQIHFEKAEVISIDKEKKTALLNNNITLINGVLKDGRCLRSDGVIVKDLKVWDEDAENRYNLYKAIPNIERYYLEIRDSIKDKKNQIPDEIILKLESKMEKLHKMITAWK